MYIYWQIFLQERKRGKKTWSYSPWKLCWEPQRSPQHHGHLSLSLWVWNLVPLLISLIYNFHFSLFMKTKAILFFQMHAFNLHANSNTPRLKYLSESLALSMFLDSCKEIDIYLQLIEIPQVFSCTLAANSFIHFMFVKIKLYRWWI